MFINFKILTKIFANFTKPFNILQSLSIMVPSLLVMHFGMMTSACCPTLLPFALFVNMLILYPPLVTKGAAKYD